MNNLNGNRKNEFRRKQEEKQRKLALKIEDEAGELREGSLKSEEAIPSLDELCAMGERVEQQTTFSAKEAIRNKIKARRDAERYKTTSTDSEKWTPNPFEDSNAAAIESPKNEDTLNTTRKHADAQSTKSAGLKTSKRRSIVEMVQKLKKYVPIVVCGDVLYYYNGYYYEAIGLEKLIKLYRKYVDYDLNNEPSLYAYKDLYQCCTTDPELERSEPENQSIHAPLENGVYDLMKKELKPHDPRRLIFTYIKASYDESAECPVFNSFLKQITHGNPQLEERFWMAIGYLMIYPARGKFFIVMGYARDSGKSVLGNFIQRLYPKESVGNLRLQEMKGTFSSMSFLNAVINLELDKDWTDKGGAENMYPKFSKGSSNACICFGFNGDGWSPYGAVAYGGSALFIDGVGENGKMNSGYGDIKISGKDMTKLLSYLDSDYNPTITIRAAQ